MSYDEGAAFLKPGDQASGATPGGPPVQKKDEGAAAPAAETKKPEKSRSQILKEQAGAMNKIEDLMSYGTFDWAITDSEASKALNLLASMPDGESAVVIQSMNQKNPTFMKRLAENAPAGARKAYPLSYLQVIIFSGNVPEMERIAASDPGAYGIGAQHAGRSEIGWLLQKVSNNFVKSMGAYQKGAGQGWFFGWANFSPDPPKTGIVSLFKQGQAEEKEKQSIAEARKADEKRVMDKYDKPASAADAKDAEALRSQVKSIEELLSYSFTDWCITDAEARKVFAMLTPLAGDAIRYAVMKLDKGPFVDRFIDNLPAADRWAHKHAFLNIMAARSPEKNVKYVKELLSYGIFDWAVTDEDARLAFYLVKTMPKDVREQFKTADGGKWWGRMEGNLDSETKESKDANFYDNKEEIQKKKLEFQEQAQKWPQGQLKMAIDMLIRMGEEDFVEKEIQSKFDQDPEHDWCFKDFGFAHVGGKRDEKIWKAWKEKSAGAKFADTMKGIGSGLKLAGKAIGGAVELGVTGKTDLNVDMQDLQNVMGGDVAGVKFAKGADEKDNKLGLSIDMDTGLLQVNASSLSIASISTLADTTRIQTGPISIQNVAIIAKWPTPKDPTQSYTLTIGGIEAKDIWQMSETAMTGVGSVSLKGFNVSAKAPVGGQPKDKTALLGQALTDIQETMTRLLGMMDTKDPAPEKVGMRVGQAFTGATDAKVSLDSLEVHDVTQSAGGHVGEVKAADLKMSITEKRKGDAVRARLSQLADKEKKGQKLDDKEATEKKDLEAALPKITALEKRETELVAKKEASEKKELDPSETEELAHIRDQLVVTSAEMSVGLISVKDVDTAGMKAKSLEVKDLKGKLTGERELEPEAGAVEIGQQKPEDAGKPKTPKKPDSKVTAEFSVGSVKGTGLVMSGKNKLEAYEGRISALQAKIDAKEGNDDDVALLASLKAELAPIHKNIVDRDEIKLIPAEKRTDAQKASLVKLSADLEPWVGRAPDTSIEEMSITGTEGKDGKPGKPAMEGKLDVNSGKMSMNVADATVKGVKSGDLSLDSANIKGLSVSADTGADMRMGGDITKTLTEANAKVEHLDVQGLKMGGTAQSVKLQQELDPLAQKSRLNPKDMTPKELERLAALPDLIKAAAADEKRLADLRKMQKEDPSKFTPDLEAEMKTLADKCDPQVVRVKSAEMNGVGVKLDTKAGKLELEAGKDGKPAVKVEGVEIGKQQPDGTVDVKTKVESAKIDKFGANMKTDKGLDGLIDPKKGAMQADVSMSGIELQGLENKGSTISSGLIAEQEALKAKEKAQKTLEAKDDKRLKQLDGLIKQAQKDEARLIELRRLQKAQGAKFPKELDLELKDLAKRLDPTYQKVAKVEVAEVNASVDTGSGQVKLGDEASGKAGVKGLNVAGVEMGQVKDDGTLDKQMSVKTAKLEGLTASVDAGSGTGLFDPTKSPALKTSMKAKGLEVEGFEKGKEGEAGHMKLDKGKIDSVSAAYDKADGGKASLEVQGAKIAGFEMSSSKLLDLQSRMGTLLAKQQGGEALSDKEAEELTKLKADFADYEKLKKDLETAKGTKKGQIQKKIEEWEKKSVTAVKSAEVSKLNVSAGAATSKIDDLRKKIDEMSAKPNPSKQDLEDLKKLKAQAAAYDKLKADLATAKGAQKTQIEKKLADWEKTSGAAGLGDITKGELNMNTQVNIDLESAKAEGVQVGDTKVKKASVTDAHVKAGNMMDEDKRSATVGVKALEAEGLSMPGTAVGKAKVNDVSANLDGRSLDANVKSAHVSGAYSGGSGASYANAQGISYSMRNMGTEKETNNTYISSFNAGGITTGTKDNGTKIAKAKGGGLAMAGGKGYKGSGGGTSMSLAGVEVEGVVNTSTDKEGTKSVASVDQAKAQGIKIGGGANKTVSVASADVNGVNYGTTKKNGDASNIHVDEAHAQGIGLGMGKDGMSASVKNADVKGVGYTDTKTDDKGDKTVTTAGIEKAHADGITFEKNGDKMTGGVANADVKGVTYGATTTDKGGKVTDTKTASVGSAGVNGVTFGMDSKSGDFNAGVKGANITDARYLDKGPNGEVKTAASVGSVDVKGVTAGGNLNDGKYHGNADQLTAKGIAYSGTDEKTGAKTNASIGSVDVKGAGGMADTNTGMYGGKADNVKVDDIRYNQVAKDGTVEKAANVKSLEGVGLEGQADTKSGTYQAGFKKVEAQGVKYQAGEKGKDGYMAVNTDYMKAGDGKDFSNIIMKPDGTIDGSIKAIELGPNTLPDGKAGNVFEQTKKKDGSDELSTTSFKLGDEQGNKGKVSVGEVRMRDFNPSDISADKSQLQVFDIGVDKFVLNSGTNTVVGKGAKLDSVFVKGQGKGQVMAGYSGLGLEEGQVKTDDGTATVKDVKSSGGYAVMTGFAPGQDFAVQYAKVKDLSAGQIDVKWKLPPPDYDKDKAAYDEKMKNWDKRKPYDANAESYDLSGIGNANGHVHGSYTYNKKEPGVLDSIGAAFIGRSVEADVDIKNGGIDGKSLDLGMGETSLLGSTVGGGVLNSFQLGFNGGSALTGPVSASGLGEYALNPSEESYNKKPDAPKKEDYTDEALAKKGDTLSRIDVDANLTDLGGGRIKAGRDFQGEMDKGGSVSAKGNVGEKLDVTANNLGFTDVKAMDGQVTVGSAGVKHAEVQITDLKDPKKSSVTVKVEGTKVTNVGYGDGGKADDKTFDEMTKK
ncbi:MAG: hypothetical protein U1F43_05165 [Myxococcota bacterium]